MAFCWHISTESRKPVFSQVCPKTQPAEVQKQDTAAALGSHYFPAADSSFQRSPEYPPSEG